MAIFIQNRYLVFIHILSLLEGIVTSWFISQKVHKVHNICIGCCDNINSMTLFSLLCSFSTGRLILDTKSCHYVQFGCTAEQLWGEVSFWFWDLILLQYPDRSTICFWLYLDPATYSLFVWRFFFLLRTTGWWEFGKTLSVCHEICNILRMKC